MRPIRPDDAGRLIAAYEQLTPETKYRRFLGAKPRLSGRDVRHLVDTDGENHLALIATCTERPDELVAAARFVRLSDDPQTADFSIVVSDDFQGLGIGSALLARLADAARNRGIERFAAMILADNLPAQRLVAGLSSTPLRRRRSGPVDELEIELGGAELSDVDPAGALELATR